MLAGSVLHLEHCDDGIVRPGEGVLDGQVAHYSQQPP
jgi:hypothetical protein